MGRGCPLPRVPHGLQQRWDPATGGQPQPGCFPPLLPPTPGGLAFPSLVPGPHLLHSPQHLSFPGKNEGGT